MADRRVRKLVGSVAELWRYPVKSMRGERIPAMVVTENGAVGDRLFAMRELKYGGIMSARLFSAMLQLRAACDQTDGTAEPRVRIELPDGSAIHADDANSGEILSALFQFPVRLERPRGDTPLTMDEINEIRDGRAFLPPRDLP